jgi:hypothetical protein
MAEGRLPVKIVLLSVLSCAVLALAGDQQIASFITKSYAREAVIVPESAFIVEGIVERGKEFIRKYSATPFARLELSHGPGARFYGSKGIDHVNVENYFHRLEHGFPGGAQTYGDIASVIKIGRSAVVRIRKNGSVLSIPIGYPSTPMPGVLQGFEILHFAPLFRSNAVDGIEVFVRSKQLPTPEGMRKLAEQLWTVDRNLTIRVLARKDSWFITHPSFPFIYAFDDPVSIPTRKEYQRDLELMAVYPPN